MISTKKIKLNKDNTFTIKNYGSIITMNSRSDSDDSIYIGDMISEYDDTQNDFYLVKGMYDMFYIVRIYDNSILNFNTFKNKDKDCIVSAIYEIGINNSEIVDKEKIKTFINKN